MLEQNISRLVEQLRNKEITSVELTQSYLDKIKELNPGLNSYITVCSDTALNAAKAADAAIEAGTAGPLAGIPIAHKDLFCTNGIKTTCASKMLNNFVPPYESTVTARIEQAAAIMLG